MSPIQKWLSANATFSIINGTACLTANNALQQLFGFEQPYVLPSLGANLLLFGVFLIYVVVRQSDNKGLVTTIIFLDAGWVVGSLVIVGFQLFGLAAVGYTIIMIIALVVALFGWQQYRFNR